MIGLFAKSNGFVRVTAGSLDSGLIRVVNGSGQGSIAGLPVYVTNGRNVSVPGLPDDALPVVCDAALDTPQSDEFCVIGATDGRTDTRCAVSVDSGSLRLADKFGAPSASVSVGVASVSAVEITLVADTLAGTITGTLPDGVIGSAYAYALATDVSPAFWSASGLPDGVAISVSGAISGIPTAPGTFAPTFYVTDKYGRQISSVKSAKIKFSAGIAAGVDPNTVIRSGDTDTFPVVQAATAIGDFEKYATSADGGIICGVTALGGFGSLVKDVSGLYVAGLGLDVTSATFQCLDISPNGQYLALGNTGETNKIWIYKRGLTNFERIAQLDTASDGCYAVAWSEDSSYLAACANNSGPSLLLKRTGDTFTQTATFSNDSNALAWSPDGQYLSVAKRLAGIQIYRKNNDGTLTYLNVGGLSDGEYNGRHVWSKDSRYIFSVGKQASGPSILRVFEWTGSVLTTKPAPPQPPDYGNYAISISLDGRLLLVKAKGATSIGDGATIYTINGAKLTVLTTETVAADGGALFIGGR